MRILKEKEAVLCKTQEQFYNVNQILSVIFNKNIGSDCWRHSKHKTCLSNDPQFGYGYDCIEWHKDHDYKILSYSEFMENDWKPKIGEKYWYIDDYYFSVDWAECGKYEHLYKNLKIGNCFRTRELARQAKKKIEQVLKECRHG